MGDLIIPDRNSSPASKHPSRRSSKVGYLPPGFTNNASTLRAQNLKYNGLAGISPGKNPSKGYERSSSRNQGNNSSKNFEPLLPTELPDDENLPVYREYLKKEQARHKDANKSLGFMIKDTKHRRNYSMDFFNIKDARSQLMEKET